jgi:hypothetical protein
VKDKTDWFPAEIKPEMSGVYETRISGFLAVGWSRWDGEHWSFQRETMEGAHFSRGIAHAMPKEWRGLAENPEPAVEWLDEEEVYEL